VRHDRLRTQQRGSLVDERDTLSDSEVEDLLAYLKTL
jgi:hypothetical protein